MSDLVRRQNTLIVDSNSKPDAWGASYTVNVGPRGAQVASTGSASPITVRAGHGFEVGDKFIVGTDITTYRAVSAVGATSVSYSGDSLSVTAGNLFNLGADGGTTAPDYDEMDARVPIYSDADGTTAITNNALTTDAQGGYGYWTYDHYQTWELVRDSSGAPVEIITGTGGHSMHQGVLYANVLATGGTGTDADPYTGWDTAITTVAHTVVMFPPRRGGVPTYYNTDNQVELGNRTTFRGGGPWKTYIRASSSFPVDTAVIRCVSTGSRFDSRLEHLGIDCNDISGSIGFQANGLEERAGLFNCAIIQSVAKGVEIYDDAGTPTAQHFQINGLVSSASSAAASGWIAVDIESEGGNCRLSDLSFGVEGNAAAVANSVGLRLQTLAGMVERVHCEGVVTGVLLGDGSATANKQYTGVLTAIAGTTNATVAGTDLIKIDNLAGNRPVVLIGCRKGNFTNILNDTLNTTTLTDANLNVTWIGEPVFTGVGAGIGYPRIVIGRNADEDMDVVFDRSSAAQVLRWDESAEAFFFSAPIRANTVAKIISGSGTPEGAVTADAGSIFMRIDGGASTTFYVKESGSGNTGWVGK